MNKEKDIFEYIVKPDIAEYREETCIDKLYSIKDTYSEKDTEKKNSFKIIKDILVSDTIKNYKNEVIMIKILYAEAIKYQSLLVNYAEGTDAYESYNFLCKMYLEDVINKLYSIYDKMFHIINNVMELRVDYQKEKLRFNEKVIDSIKNGDDIRNKLRKIKKTVEKHRLKSYRNDITHNESESFIRIKQDYNIKELNANFHHEIDIKEIISEIEDFTNILYNQLIIIKEMID